MELTKNHLLTKEIAESIPMLYANEGIETDDKIIRVKFFAPTSSWTWYIVEACAYMDDGTDLNLKEAWDKQDKIREVFFYGYVEGLENEWGESVLSEFQSLDLPGGLHIERDYYFAPIPFGQLKKTGG